MEYKFLDPEKGEEIIIPVERWVWGVVYKPTQAQLDRSKIETEKRNMVLKAELNQRIKAMKSEGRNQKDIDTLTTEYEVTMSIPAGLERDELHQFGNDGKFHRIGEIDQDRIEMASFYFYDDYSMKKRIDIPFRPGMKLIHKYRNIKPSGHKNFIKVYMFGYKYEGMHTIFFILPDDRIIVCPDDQLDLTRFDLTNKN